MANDMIPIEVNELGLVVSQPLDQNPALVYLAGLGNERSRRVQRDALAKIAEVLTGAPDLLSCNWAALRFQHTQAVRARLMESYSPASANRMLAALRGAIKAAWRLGQMDAESYHRAADLDPVRGKRLKAGRALTGGEIAALMAACEDDPTPAGPRDAALIVTMYPGGLRRAEVVGLDLSDYDPDSGELRVRAGKGNKDRTAYLTDPGAKRALLDWLTIRGEDPGALFWPIDKGGNLRPRRMTNQAVYNLCEKRGKAASIAGFSPHDLRRTTITDLLEAGADTLLVSKLVGHESPETTGGYDRRPEAAKAKAAGLLHVPYRGRLV